MPPARTPRSTEPDTDTTVTDDPAAAAPADPPAGDTPPAEPVAVPSAPAVEEALARVEVRWIVDQEMFLAKEDRIIGLGDTFFTRVDRLEVDPRIIPADQPWPIPAADVKE